jgi:hypothetical protein
MALLISRRGSCITGLSFSLALLALLATGVQAQNIDEYQVKAAFLYNFAKFVEWPPQAFKGPSDPITICVLGRNPFNSSLDAAVSGKTIESRAFVIQQVSNTHQAGQCQILFVSSSERKRVQSILEDLKSSGILTVGETEDFAAEGGVVTFKLEGGRVRLEINVNAAEQQRLRISSKLLSLAQIVSKK